MNEEQERPSKCAQCGKPKGISFQAGEMRFCTPQCAFVWRRKNPSPLTKDELQSMRTFAMVMPPMTKGLVLAIIDELLEFRKQAEGLVEDSAVFEFPDDSF